MPPKPKFTKEEVISAALNIVSEKGVEALTAQELRNALNCSSSPIFTLFDTMNEIKCEVRIAAMRFFENFSKSNMSNMPLFKQIGMKTVLFGIKHPKLYQLLFMQENTDTLSFEDLFGKLGTTASVCIQAIKDDYKLTSSQAVFLFENVWIYTFGIGALCATKTCSFSKDELGQMLSTQFDAVMSLIKSGKAKINPDNS